MEIPIPFPRLAIFTRYVPLLDTTDSEPFTESQFTSLCQLNITNELAEKEENSPDKFHCSDVIYCRWRRTFVVMCWSRSTKLLYAEPG